jgi:two-component system, response regulator, stage 0 sporulation protein F
MPKKSSGVSVLIVDDEPLIRWALSETLADQGFTVFEAHDGQSAVTVLTDPRRPVDVILLDYMLPDSNDLQLLAAIRRLSPRSGIVMLTDYGTPELAAEAKRLGASCVVNKPIEMRDVAELVSRARVSASP